MNKNEKGTIYFSYEKKKGKIKIEGTITGVRVYVDKLGRAYQNLTLTTSEGEAEFNYFGARKPIVGKRIVGEGLYFSDKCKRLRTYRTLRGN